MKNYPVVAAVAFSLWGPTANAGIECKAEIPSAAKEYWSWRLIDGKRCWYPGRPGMDKTNLTWAPSGPARPAGEDDRLEDVRNFAPPQVNPTSSSPAELSFAERWPY